MFAISAARRFVLDPLGYSTLFSGRQQFSLCKVPDIVLQRMPVELSWRSAH